MKRAGVILCLLWCLALPAAEVIPPRPTRHFTDHAGVVPATRAEQFNQQLADFERATSSQIVVAVFPRMESASSIEDYANRVFRAWQVGRAGTNNGAAMFVFVQDRKLRIEVGYGLEGALPDALCKRIISEEITPRFRAGDYPGGLGAGINALLAATRGEYQGTGRTVAEAGKTPPVWLLVGIGVFLLLLFLAFIAALRRAIRGTVYQRRGRRSTSWGWSGRSGSWSSGGSSGSSWSGGTFSGGGGSSGGGGASGDW